MYSHYNIQPYKSKLKHKISINFSAFEIVKEKILDFFLFLLFKSYTSALKSKSQHTLTT